MYQLPINMILETERQDRSRLDFVNKNRDKLLKITAENLRDRQVFFLSGDLYAWFIGLRKLPTGSKFGIMSVENCYYIQRVESFQHYYISPNEFVFVDQIVPDLSEDEFEVYFNKNQMELFMNAIQRR